MQSMRVKAFSDFIDDVKNDGFPSEEYEVGVEDSVKSQLKEYITK